MKHSYSPFSQFSHLLGNKKSAGRIPALPTFSVQEQLLASCRNPATLLELAKQFPLPR